MADKDNKELQLQTGPYRTTVIGTEVIRKSTKSEWALYGAMLCKVDEAKQWAIGDWLVDGKWHYGDGLYQKAARILGVEEQTLRRQASISAKFELLLRSNSLSWWHHYEVASLKTIEENKKTGKLRLSKKVDYEKIKEFLLMAEKDKLSVRELRERVSLYKRRQQEEIRLANEPTKYSVILADPAWEYEFSKSSSRKIDNKYPPSSLEDMKRLNVPAASNSVLFMWATSPKIREALELIVAWGFEYKTNAVWVKDKIGMGYYFRQKHELLFVATRGIVQLPDEGKRPESVFFASRGKHSEKPEVAYEIIEKMYPEYNKLEMFARTKRSGWTAWGDEIDADST